MDNNLLGLNREAVGQVPVLASDGSMQWTELDLLLIDFPYDRLSDPANLPDWFVLFDHLGGFDANLDNKLLENLQQYCSQNDKKFLIYHHVFLEPSIRAKYPNLDLRFQLSSYRVLWKPFSSYQMHPDLDYKNFLCSFNHAPHVGRKLLVSILERFGWFDPAVMSKHFVCSKEEIDGHLQELTGDRSRFYRKFFLHDESQQFLHTVHRFEDQWNVEPDSYHKLQDHAVNIHSLDHVLTSCFVHVVAETMATSYYPFVTEKFLYSVVTRGLFVSYAQPGWHQHLEKYYGFRRYQKIFDYSFDSIRDPVERLVALMCMLSKFSRLSRQDWSDLYLMELDTIEFNYDHYHSGNYLKTLLSNTSGRLTETK